MQSIAIEILSGEGQLVGNGNIIARVVSFKNEFAVFHDQQTMNRTTCPVSPACQEARVLASHPFRPHSAAQ